MFHHTQSDGEKVPVREVVLHCSAVPTGYWRDATPLEVWVKINQWHTERGFKNGFGYHGLVMPDGKFLVGRPPHKVGAHVKGHNLGTLGLLLIESKEIKEIGEFGDFFDERQRYMARQWIVSLGGIRKVSGHNDYAPKLCPGFKVKSEEWLSP